jgi:hypothetical protein
VNGFKQLVQGCMDKIIVALHNFLLTVNTTNICQQKKSCQMIEVTNADDNKSGYKGVNGLYKLDSSLLTRWSPERPVYTHMSSGKYVILWYPSDSWAISTMRDVLRWGASPPCNPNSIILSEYHIYKFAVKTRIKTSNLRPLKWQSNLSPSRTSSVRHYILSGRLKDNIMPWQEDWQREQAYNNGEFSYSGPRPTVKCIRCDSPPTKTEAG